MLLAASWRHMLSDKEVTRKSQLVSILISKKDKIFYRGLRFEKHFQSCYIVHEFCIFLSDIAIDDSENFKRLLSNEWLLTPFVVFTNEKKENLGAVSFAEKLYSWVEAVSHD